VFEHCKVLHLRAEEAKREGVENAAKSTSSSEKTHVTNQDDIGSDQLKKSGSTGTAGYVDDENKSLEKCKIDCSIIMTVCD
jgi:hypothetical protein